MSTTIYFIRHSEPMNVKNDKSKDNFQLKNEKMILSIEGERRAKILSENKELENIDILYCSNYIRAISTAKYIANKNNVDINVLDDFGERKFGVNSFDEIQRDFGILQLEDENYKMPNGESKKEVQERMFNSLIKVLSDNKNKRIAVVSHGTAMMFLFLKWCDLILKEDWSYTLSFYNKKVFEGKISAPEVFKLTFDNNFNLTNIENIKVKF